MLVVIVGRMMMSRVTVVGVVEGDVCAHEQPICQTPHVITTTVTHSASTKQTFSSLVKKKYNTEIVIQYFLFGMNTSGLVKLSASTEIGS